MDWKTWIAANIDTLKAGNTLIAPTTLPDPAGELEHVALAEQKGQLEDYAISLWDGGRVHVNQFADGSCLVHYDQIDPARDPISMLAHFLQESRPGIALSGLCFFFMIGYFLKGLR